MTSTAFSAYPRPLVMTSKMAADGGQYCFKGYFGSNSAVSKTYVPPGFRDDLKMLECWLASPDARRYERPLAGCRSTVVERPLSIPGTFGAKARHAALGTDCWGGSRN
jgi:hypothetical protein